MGARRKFVGIAAASVLVLSGGFATTADAASAKVTKQQMPSQAQVAAIVPSLKGGETYSEAERSFDGPGARCDSTKTTKAQAGRMTVYMPKVNLEENVEDAVGGVVMVHTLRFSNKAKAKRLVSDFARFAKKCSGKVIEGASGKRVNVGKVGQQRVGFQIRDKQVGLNGVVVLAREGRTVVQTFQFFSGSAKKTQTAKVTKVALKRSR